MRRIPCRDSLGANHLECARELLAIVGSINPLDIAHQKLVARINFLLLRVNARPERIGITRKELSKLANAHDVASAERLLTRARELREKYFETTSASKIKLIKKFLARARQRLEDIGTTSAELQKLSSALDEDERRKKERRYQNAGSE